MKLSNTMMINEKLLPTSKKAFTLAEVLITLSILGVVAALTIPTLVNRQSDLAAQTKLKKAISAYEDAVAIFMAENEVQNASTLASNGNQENPQLNCNQVSNYFKVVEGPASNANADCRFVTADGALWIWEPRTGFAYVQDSANAPRYGVTLYAINGQVNGTGTTDNVSNVPTTLFLPATADIGGQAPLHGVYQAAGNTGFLNLKTSDMGDNNANQLEFNGGHVGGNITPRAN